MSAPELRKTILVSSACLFLGVACGWWLRGDPAPTVVVVENAADAKSHAVPAPTAAARESSPAQDPAPIPFATAIRAAFDDRDPLSRGIRIREIIRNLSAAELPAAVTEVDRLHGPDSWQVLEMLGWRWAQFDPAAAIAFAVKSGDYSVEHIGARVLEGAIANLADRDPAAAAQFLEQMPAMDWLGEEARGRAIGTLLAKWMSSNAKAASAWVQRLPKQALDLAVDSWVEQNGKSALDFMARDPLSANKDSPLSRAFFRWSVSSAPEDAVNWALAQSDEKIRAAVLPTAIMGIADVDPARAAKLFADENQTGGELDVTGLIAKGWAKKNPLAAAKWVQGLPSLADRESAYSALGRYWPQNDPAGATQWLQQLPAGSDRDFAVGGFAAQVVDRDPVGAIEWIKTIGNESARNEALIWLGGKWMENDPSSAKTWIQATDLIPAARKQDLIERRRNSR